MSIEKRFHRLAGRDLSQRVAKKINESLETLAATSGQGLSLGDLPPLYDSNPQLADTTVIGSMSRYAEPSGLHYQASWLNATGRDLSRNVLGKGIAYGQVDFSGQSDSGEFSGVFLPTTYAEPTDQPQRQRAGLEVSFACRIEEDIPAGGDFELYSQAARIGVAGLFTTAAEPGVRGDEHIFTGRAPEAVGREIAWALGNLRDSNPRPINP